MKLTYKTLILPALFLLFLSLAISLNSGAVGIPWTEILAMIKGGGNETSRIILLSLRLPRVLQAAVVGAGLAVVGCFFQGLFRNPMADPYVLGMSSGAAFGATIAIIAGLGVLGVSSAAFCSALATVYVVYMIAKSGPKIAMTAMLLAGITISACMYSVISLLMLFNHDELSNIVFWTMGSFSLVSWNDLLFSSPLILAGIGIMYVFARDLNAIITGEEIAEHLGINTELVKKVVLLTGSFITAASVSIGGIIGFVGLIVPHICRLLVGPDNRVLVPFSALFGAIFLVVADTLARTLLAPAEIPVGIITAICGGPFFLYLLIITKSKSEGM